MTTTEKTTDKTALPAPLLAVLGAGDLAAKAVADAFAKAKERAESARGAVEELPAEVAGLREKLDPAELRKLLDAYTSAALTLYQKLSEQGEDALDKLREQPQVKQLEEAIEAAQARAAGVAGDVLSKVTFRTRSLGEKAARATEDLTENVAEAVEEVGAEAAHEVRSTTRKAANKTAAASRSSNATAARKAPAGDK
ncbi:hypothetical protein [Actinokineospora bangkokensis]|uniref:Heparin-binding hemagglutinin n=1 Tax=Actinokineospora bangkokensis TaxID=1193682 RepID=A0A1Q9LFF9_9PSEU|nr:hypothetical protein [Actinokineospora bangkokensis]OLR90772.1 hypothetical protein BJP25_29755 [Actinokineospora bangkokensis]